MTAEHLIAIASGAERIQRAAAFRWVDYYLPDSAQDAFRKQDLLRRQWPWSTATGDQVTPTEVLLAIHPSAQIAIDTKDATAQAIRRHWEEKTRAILGRVLFSRIRGAAAPLRTLLAAPFDQGARSVYSASESLMRHLQGAENALRNPLFEMRDIGCGGFAFYPTQHAIVRLSVNSGVVDVVTALNDILAEHVHPAMTRVIQEFEGALSELAE